jgi:hypothetical protein
MVGTEIEGKDKNTDKNVPTHFSLSLYVHKGGILNIKKTFSNILQSSVAECNLPLPKTIQIHLEAKKVK